MIIKSSVYKSYIYNILEQSFSPCDMEEVIEKVAYRLDMPFKLLNERIKNYFSRNPDILIVPYGDEKRVMLKSKFMPVNCQCDVVKNVLNYRKIPIEKTTFWAIMYQFDEFKTEYGFRDSSEFDERENEIIAYFVKREQIECLDESSFLIGLEEWDSVVGYIKIPHEHAPISVLRKYRKYNDKLFEKLGNHIIKPFYNALDDIPFKIRTYAEQLNNLIEEVFNVDEFDEINQTFYNNYKECMAHIKKHKKYPTAKLNPDIHKWRLDMPSEGVNQMLYIMCYETLMTEVLSPK